MQAALDLADSWLGLARIELHVQTDNAAGVFLCEKFGFEIEGPPRPLRLQKREVRGCLLDGA